MNPTRVLHSMGPDLVNHCSKQVVITDSVNLGVLMMHGSWAFDEWMPFKDAKGSPIQTA